MIVSGRAPVVVAAGVGALASACSSAPPVTMPPAQLAALVEELALPAGEVKEPARLDAEMLAWLAAEVGKDLPPAERVEALLAALGSPRRLGLSYDNSFTGTAPEVFASRRFNCLSFSHLFVGMARELGVDAYYVEVERSRFARSGDLVIHSRHVTAGFEEGDRRMTLDFGLDPGANRLRMGRISDRRAVALHYSNRGAELLTAGERREAARRFATAVRIDPAIPAGWTNLGVGLRRLGRLDAAEAAYRHALELDADYLPAWGNLAGLLRMRGEGDAAAEILALLSRRRNRNPYLHLALGDASREAGDLGDADRYYRRAYRLAPGDPETRAVRGLVALASGNEEEARRWLARARQAEGAEESPRVAELAAALEDDTETP